MALFILYLFANAAAPEHDKIFLMLLQARLNPITLESHFPSWLSKKGDLTWPNPENRFCSPLFRAGKHHYRANFRPGNGHQWVND